VSVCRHRAGFTYTGFGAKSPFIFSAAEGVLLMKITSVTYFKPQAAAPRSKLDRLDTRPHEQQPHQDHRHPMRAHTRTVWSHHTLPGQGEMPLATARNGMADQIHVKELIATHLS
jgi:hypothetical protein